MILLEMLSVPLGALQVLNLAWAFVCAGVRLVLWDCDGCILSKSGVWHPRVIAEAVNRMRIAIMLGVSVTIERCKSAYEGPGHGIPYPELILKNLLEPIFGRELSKKALGQFDAKLTEVAGEFARGEFAPDIEVRPQPGVELFLWLLWMLRFNCHVVTMTPTVLVKALLHRAGLTGFFGDMYGCDQFTVGKENRALWDGVVARYEEVELKHCAVIEDGRRGIIGAADALMLVVMAQDVLDAIAPRGLRPVYVTQTDGNLYTVVAYQPF